MTLGEFLHPLARASQRDVVLALMYYLKRYEEKDAVTTSDLAAAFKRSMHVRGRRIANLAAVLNRSAPFAHSPGSDGRRLLWALTDTGESHVRQLLNLPETDPEVEHDVSLLQKLSDTVSDAAVRGYIEEAVLCLRVGALRASTVFLWTGAVVALRDQVWRHGAGAIDARLKSHNPKARAFKKKDDFAYVKDADLLQIAQDLSVLDKSEKTLLGHALDLRNQCGHPVQYVPGAKKVSAFVEDVVGIVWR